MIIEKIQWKNFLSYGNTFTEINLNQNKIIGITGINGEGKSVIIDAISFAITGKLFRPKVKKSQIVNTKNKKNCLVEITLIKNKDVYVVRRGIKPDIFEILKNNKRLDESSSIKDFQVVLEQIFRFNPRILKNTIFMSSMDYKPFLKFDAAQKREYIEGILNLQIFGDMLDEVKIDLSLLKKEKQEKEVEFQLIEREINTIKEMNKKIENDEKSNKKILQKEIDDISNKISELEKTLLEKKQILKVNREKYDIRYKKYQKGIENNHAEQNKLEEKIKNNDILKQRELKDIEKENNIKSFFKNNSTCNTCKQDINEKHKKNILNDVNERIEKINNSINNIEKTSKLYQDKINSLKEKEKQILLFGEKVDKFSKNNIIPIQIIIDEISTDISLNKGKIDTKLEELNKKSEKIKDISSKEKIKKYLEIELKKINEKQTIMDISKKILSDKGIKRYIVNKYIPILNKYVNEFLDLMGASYRMKFDDELQEYIVLKGYEKLSYYSFSSGEKQRCDLALLFAFLKIAKLKNSFDSNLLILDEIIDASMDETGLNGVMNILENFKFKENKTILNISHRNSVKNMLDITYIAKKKIFSELIEG